MNTSNNIHDRRELMEDLAKTLTDHLLVWTVDLPAGKAPSFLDEMSRMASAKGIEILVVRADMVFGADHIRSALYHAKKSMDEGRNSSSSLAMETLLYASGERQLSSAIKKMSAGIEAERVVVAQLTPGALEVRGDWKPIGPSEPGTQLGRLREFGVSEEELRTLSGKDGAELVLEKVAAVDVIKK